MKPAPAKSILHRYLDSLHETHLRTRTPELSYRAALENLLNTVGESIDPAVHATAELADTGSGHPDFGLFEVRSGNARGVVEVKSLQEDVADTAGSEQVARYCRQYGLVLVTNYRDFLLVGPAEGGGVSPRGRCTLAADPEAFWRLRPSALAKLMADELVDFLIGVMKHGAPILRPRDLADDLARHACEAKRRLERHEMAALEPLQKAMEQALGLHFTGRDGEAFFRSSLVQTLFYGLFSGWMLWRQTRHRAGTFSWREATENLALPLIGDLYEEIARPTRLADLHLRDPLEWATASLNSVVEEVFFKNFDEQHAITLFYEPFLQSFDPELRKQLGVWYTPPEIVQYMVGRVDQLLRSELGIADGLADDNVYVLDPAAGTGSYLVEVARRIHATLTEQGHGALAATRVKRALCSRVFGFEILPAPYVVSHLQLGVLLRGLGTALGPNERAGVYLTNALTGWEPPKGPKEQLAFHFLEEEQEAARKVKREAPIIVILGNPPYNGFAGVAQEEEAELIAPYKAGLAEEWGVRKQLLDDLYVRFYGLAERRIAEVGQRGIVCFITNSGWLDGLSHPMMRKHITTSFSKIWIDNCNGDRYRTGKRTPEGKPDQSMFTTDQQPIGIEPGTAIATLVKSATDTRGSADCYYRDLWGKANEKRAMLLQSLTRSTDTRVSLYTKARIERTLRFAIGTHEASDRYLKWPAIVDLFAEQFKGVQPGRGGAMVSIDPEPLATQMKTYFNPEITNAEVRERYPELMAREAGYSPDDVRGTYLTGFAEFREENLVRIHWVPFDTRTLYDCPSGRLLHRRRGEFADQVAPGNLFLACTQRPRKGVFPPPLPTSTLASYYLFDPYAALFPLRIRKPDRIGQQELPGIREDWLQGICDSVCVNSRMGSSPQWTPEAEGIAEAIFYHILAVLWSPAYRTENEAALRQDWPRVPVPADAGILEASAQLGRTVADLLLPDKPVQGVTTGRLRAELRTLAVPSKVGGKPIEEPADTRVEAGWGFRGQRNAVMCGKGSVVPCPDDPEHALNIYINDKVYWANVPADVWTMTIGGYPVVKKWLSYREYKVLGRALRMEEIAYVTEVVRRLKALLLLGEPLDQNYRAAAAAPQIELE